MRCCVIRRVRMRGLHLWTVTLRTFTAGVEKGIYSTPRPSTPRRSCWPSSRRRALSVEFTRIPQEAVAVSGRTQTNARMPRLRLLRFSASFRDGQRAANEAGRSPAINAGQGLSGDAKVLHQPDESNAHCGFADAGAGSFAKGCSRHERALVTKKRPCRVNVHLSTINDGWNKRNGKSW
jgi:hypothetical protein